MLSVGEQSMLRIAVCDDDSISLGITCDFIEDYRKQNDADLSVSTFSSGVALVEDVKSSSEYDIYFLDIYMEGMNGIETAKKLREMGQSGDIAFISSTTEFVLQAFEVRACGYLVKPITKEKLFDILNSLAQASLHKKEQKSVNVKTNQGETKIPLSDIQYIEKVDRKICFHLVGGSMVYSNSFRGSFQSVLEDIGLPKDSYVFFSHGAVVNLNNVVSYKSGSYEINLDDGSQLYCSRTKASEFRLAFLAFESAD